MTVAAILQAAAEVIAAEGFGRASTNRIAARAGVSIGSLYQYFANKEAILAGLLEEHFREIAVVVERTVAGFEDPSRPVSEVLRGLFLSMVEMHRRNPALARALDEAEHQPAARRDRHDGEMEEFGRRLESALARHPEIRVRDHVAATWVVTRAVGALSRALAHEAPPDEDPESLIDESVAMLTGYLAGAEPRR